MNSDPRRLHYLFGAHADSSITPGEHTELQECLRTDPNARHQWFVYQDIDDGLHDLALETASVKSLPAIESSKTKPWLRWRPLTSAAAVLVLFVGLACWFALRSEEHTVAIDILASDGAPQFVVGQTMKLQRVMLESGSIQFRLDSGVVCDAAGPTEIEIINAMRLRLVRGRISADVGDRGKGFTVITDAGEVVDLGTRFGVEADHGGETRVAVLSGQVKVRTADATGDSAFTTLNEGEAVRLNKHAGMLRWQQVALEAKSTRLAVHPKAGVLGEVRDNLGNGGLRPYYGVVAGGMSPGAIAFTDKPNVRWAPLPGDTLPDWLAGADSIRMYVNFRHRMNYELTLTLRETATVFVLIDSRQTPQDWLATRFKKTSSRVRVGPGALRSKDEDGSEIGPDGRTYRWFEVWVAEAGPGEFKLGPARTAGSATSPRMYGVAVKPRLAH